MSLNTYGAIKTAVADWAYTGGSVTSTLVGTDFWPQMQSMMYYGDGKDIPPLRIRAMVSTGTLTPDSNGAITITSGVASGWLEFIELVPTYNYAYALDYMEPWSFRKQVDALSSSVAPQWIYTVEGGTLYVAPKNTGTITAAWYQKFTALSSDSDTDWIVTNAPQVYLNGCLMLACAYADDEREAQFRAKFAAGIKGLNMNDQAQRASGSRPVARPRAVV